MIDRTYRLGIGRQAKAFGISRGSVYHLPQPTSAADLALMRKIGELHLDHPFAGSRMLEGLIKAEGHEVGGLRGPPKSASAWMASAPGATATLLSVSGGR